VREAVAEMKIDLIRRRDLVGCPEVDDLLRPTPLSEITCVFRENVPGLGDLLLEIEGRLPYQFSLAILRLEEQRLHATD
jgi:hypothetical protein